MIAVSTAVNTDVSTSRTIEELGAAATTFGVGGCCAASGAASIMTHPDEPVGVLPA